MIALIFNGESRKEVIDYIKSLHVWCLDGGKKYKVTVEEYAPIDEDLMDELDGASGD
jgi:hypothetical protein